VKALRRLVEPLPAVERVWLWRLPEWKGLVRPPPTFELRRPPARRRLAKPRVGVEQQLPLRELKRRPPLIAQAPWSLLA